MTAVFLIKKVIAILIPFEIAKPVLLIDNSRSSNAGAHEPTDFLVTIIELLRFLSRT